jgi:hypothetical protein
MGVLSPKDVSPKDVKPPILSHLVKVEAIDVRINIDESSSLSMLTEIICCY